MDLQYKIAPETGGSAYEYLTSSQNIEKNIFYIKSLYNVCYKKEFMDVASAVATGSVFKFIILDVPFIV